MKTTIEVEKNILSLDELYNIFDSELYKDAKLAFVDDPFAQRNTQLDFTQLSADRLKNAPLLYRHIIAERILQAEDEEINNAPMRNYDPELILRLCYLWMHPITQMENPEREGLILMNNAQIAKETKCNLAFREKDIKQRFNRLANLGIFYFAENFENCFLPDETIHNWDYITLNLHAKYNEIVEDPEITLERAISYVPFDIRALRYSILRIIAPRCGGKRAAEILKKLQSEWNFIKLCDYDNFLCLNETQRQTFENFISHGFETELDKWENGDMENRKKNKPLIRNSFRYRLGDVYEVLRDFNYVEDGMKDTFIKAMEFRLDENVRMNWHGKKYHLASFAKYAFEGSKELTWEAANMWMCNGKVITHPELKNNYNRSVKASDTRFWENLFMKHLA